MNMDMTPLKQAGVETMSLRDACNKMIDADDRLKEHALKAESMGALVALFDEEFNEMGMRLTKEMLEALDNVRTILGRG